MRLQIALCVATMAGLCPASTAVVPPANDTPEQATEIVRCAQGPLSGDSQTASDDLDPSRWSKGQPIRAGGRDIVFRIELQSRDEVGLTYVQPMADAVVYVLEAEAEESGPCLFWADRAGPGETEHLSFLAPRDGTYYLVLDAKEKNSGGPWDAYYTIHCSAGELGACCFQDGSCLLTTESDCLGRGGAAWIAEAPCTPDLGKALARNVVRWGQLKQLFR